jgi:hypothetical protein
VYEGGLMIDLAGMRSVRVDSGRHTARVEGGTTWSRPVSAPTAILVQDGVYDAFTKRLAETPAR